MTDQDLPPHISALLSLLGLASFLVNLDLTALNIAMPMIALETGSTLTAVSRVALLYGLALIGFSLVVGRLSDIFGIRSMMVIGFILFGVSSLFCGLAGGIGSLAFLRTIQGLGGSILYVMGPAVVTRLVSRDRQGRVFGILAVVPALAICIGPAIGGMITSFLSWRYIFFINAPLCLGGILLAIGALRHKPGETGVEPGFDYSGAVLNLLFLCTFLLGLNMGSQWGWKNPVVLSCLAASPIILALFVWRERSASRPLLDLRLFSNRGFSLGSTAMFFLLFLLGGFYFILPFYLDYYLALDIYIAGLVFMLAPAMTVLTSPLAGFLAEHMPMRVLCTAGCLLFLASQLLLFGANGSQVLWVVGAALLLMGMGEGLFLAPNMNLTMQQVPSGREGVASALVTTVRALAQAMGLVFYEILCSAYSAAGAGSKMLAARAFQSVFVLSGAVALVAMLATMFVAEPRKSFRRSR